MEPARIETMLDHGWSLIDLLHQWLSKQPQDHQDSEVLVNLICSLQTFWSRLDDLEMNQLARNSLALEQFFERLCAKKVDLSADQLKDLRAGICSLELLLLEFEATREEPAISDLDSLHRLEKRTSRRFLTESINRTIDIPNPISRNDRSVILAESNRQPRLGSPVFSSNSISSESTSSPRLAMSAPMRIEQKFVPRLDPFVVTGIRPSELSVPPEDPTTPSVIEPQFTEPPIVSETILILEESLFYRQLLSMALQCSGYESEALEPFRIESIDQILPWNYRAILVTSRGSTMMHDQIQRSRETSNSVVIGLKANDQDDQFDVDLDAIVLQSKPQQLVSILDQLLSSAIEFPRKIA